MQDECSDPEDVKLPKVLRILTPLLNDAYTTPDPQAKTKLIDLLATMTCVENGITMNDVDRHAIEEGLRRAF